LDLLLTIPRNNASVFRSVKYCWLPYTKCTRPPPLSRKGFCLLAWAFLNKMSRKNCTGSPSRNYLALLTF